jgi:protein phosphatase PTC7
LGFKVLACGMRKNGPLPIPKPNYFIDKGDFGDDAGFFSENVYGDAIGIADGATGNCMLGYDPGDFSRNLMQSCAEIFIQENKMFDAKTLLLKAYDIVQDKTCYGSCTACVLTLSHDNNLMTAANVGDTGYCVLRENKIVYKSIPQRISFECPKQLDSYPWKEKSRKMGVSYTEIL